MKTTGSPVFNVFHSHLIKLILLILFVCLFVCLLEINPSPEQHSNE